MTAEQINENWKKLKRELEAYTESPEQILGCLRELYSVFDKKSLAWLGGLYDCELGGFYYSESAREGEEFFPDIESTGQGIAILNVSGAIGSYGDIPEWMRSGIAGFICSCEDPDNGYFYNPQWEKEAVDKNILRRSRDFGWAIELAEKLDFQMPYFTMFSSAKASGRSVPKFLESKESFLIYLNSLDWNSGAYESMDKVVNQYDTILYSGYGDVAVEFVETKRDKETGLWGVGHIGKEMQLRTLCAALNLYSAMRMPISEPMKIFDFALERFTDRPPDVITSFCNRFSTLKLLMSIVSKNNPQGYESTLRQMSEKFVKELPKTALTAAEILKRFKKQDGSFSYFEHYSSSSSQGMSVARANSREGDINATLHALGVWDPIIYIITSGKYRIPLFSNEDMRAFEAAASGGKIKLK